MLTGVGAVMNTAQVRPGESVLIYGLGGVGLAALLGALAAGAQPVVAVDPFPEKRALALELGRLPAIGDVLGVVPYGSNPRLSEPAKRQRKAGLVTLHGILESKEGSRYR